MRVRLTVIVDTTTMGSGETVRRIAGAVQSVCRRRRYVVSRSNACTKFPEPGVPPCTQINEHPGDCTPGRFED